MDITWEEIEERLHDLEVSDDDIVAKPIPLNFAKTGLRAIYDRAKRVKRLDVFNHLAMAVSSSDGVVTLWSDKSIIWDPVYLDASGTGRIEVITSILIDRTWDKKIFESTSIREAATYVSTFILP